MTGDSYTGFASVYDTFMDNVPYDEWAEYVTGILKEQGITEGLVCELGCGTGQMTRRLADAGYEMIGIDLSAEMLDIAREAEYDRVEDLEQSILYLQQDMREFELYGTVAAIVSLCDSMNYITDEASLLQVFRLVNNYLDPGGLFLFDMNTEYKYKELLGNTTIAENREDASFIWENFFDEETGINEYDLTIFKKADLELEDEDGSTDALFERFTETHLQKAYSFDTIKHLLAEAGMEFVAVYGAGTKEAPAKDCERMYILAREARQEKKLYLNAE